MTVEELVPEGLWSEIAPLLPAPPPRPKGGRRRVPYRNAVAGIVHVLRTGAPWRLVPAGELGQHQHPGQASGDLIGANPTDRGKPGSKYHLIVDGAGVPLAALVSAANAHDSRLLVPLVDRVGPVRGRVGRPRRRPQRLYANGEPSQPSVEEHDDGHGPHP